MEIAGFVVGNMYRRKGIGEKLMLPCEQWARKRMNSVNV
ncbi:GNAT family N-acetyltransferase [Alicyclobacillus sp. SO9]|nr:GNAT family N-acetyltransferase [Alicyclobacillus sp. SO9]